MSPINMTSVKAKQLRQLIEWCLQFQLSMSLIMKLIFNVCGHDLMSPLLQGPEGKLGPPGNRGRHGKKVRTVFSRIFSVKYVFPQIAGRRRGTQSKVLLHSSGSRGLLSHLVSSA